MTIYLVCAINIIYIYLKGPCKDLSSLSFFPQFDISKFDNIGTIDMITVQKAFEHFGTLTDSVEITQIKALLDEVMLVEVSMTVLRGVTAMIILILMIDLFD